MVQRTGLQKEFDFYLENQEALVEKYNGKVIVVKDGKVLGSYDSHYEAIVETQKVYELGTFLVQLVTPGKDAYTATLLHSRRVKAVR